MKELHQKYYWSETIDGYEVKFGALVETDEAIAWRDEDPLFMFAGARLTEVAIKATQAVESYLRTKPIG